MPLLPAFVLMAQAAQGAPVEITLRYRRPSTVVAQAVGLGATFVADDSKSRIQIGGTPDQIRDAREFVRLFDIPRKPIHIQVTVSSALDHLDWTVDARLTTGQRWKTADDETGAEIALDPTLEGDGKLRVKVLARCGRSELGSTMRLKKGQARSLVLGKRIEQRFDVSPDGNGTISESAVPLPTVTVRYLGG